MSVILPKRGISNPYSYNNNYIPTKDTYPPALLNTGGDNFFVGTNPVYCTVDGIDNLLQINSNQLNGYDGSLISALVGRLGQKVAIDYKWIVDGIFCLDIKTPVIVPATIKWSGTVGYGLSTKCSIITNSTTVGTSTIFYKSIVYSNVIYDGDGASWNIVSCLEPNPTFRIRPVLLTNNNRTAYTNEDHGSTDGSFLKMIIGNKSMISGKWYWECVVSGDVLDFWAIGIGITSNANTLTNTFIGQQSDSVGFYNYGSVVSGSVNTASPHYYTGDTIMIAFNADLGYVWFGINGVWNDGDPTTGASPSRTVTQGNSYIPAATLYRTNYGATLGCTLVTGTDRTYPIPTGFGDLPNVPMLSIGSNKTTTITFVSTHPDTNPSTMATPVVGAYGANVSNFNVSYTNTTGGCVMYVQFGYPTLSDVYSWINSDLIESPNDYSGSPNTFPYSINVDDYASVSTSDVKMESCIGYLDAEANGIAVSYPYWIWNQYSNGIPNFDYMHTITELDVVSHATPNALYAHDQISPPSPILGHISGIVTENSTPISRAIVRLYRRESGWLLNAAMTDINGHFTFTNLDPNISTYYVIALDPESGVAYNAKVFDRLTPTVG